MKKSGPKTSSKSQNRNKDKIKRKSGANKKQKKSKVTSKHPDSDSCSDDEDLEDDGKEAPPKKEGWKEFPTRSSSQLLRQDQNDKNYRKSSGAKSWKDSQPKSNKTIRIVLEGTPGQNPLEINLGTDVSPCITIRQEPCQLEKPEKCSQKPGSNFNPSSPCTYSPSKKPTWEMEIVKYDPKGKWDENVEEKGSTGRVFEKKEASSKNEEDEDEDQEPTPPKKKEKKPSAIGEKCGAYRCYKDPSAPPGYAYCVKKHLKKQDRSEDKPFPDHPQKFTLPQSSPCSPFPDPMILNCSDQTDLQLGSTKNTFGSLGFEIRICDGAIQLSKNPVLNDTADRTKNRSSNSKQDSNEKEGRKEGCSRRE